MKFLKSDLIEVQIEYLGRKYFVSKFYIIFNYYLYNLDGSIEDINEEGYLVSKPSDLHLKNKPIGLFIFNDLYGEVAYSCSSGYCASMHNMNLNFHPRTHFFVLEG